MEDLSALLGACQRNRVDRVTTGKGMDKGVEGAKRKRKRKGRDLHQEKKNEKWASMH